MEEQAKVRIVKGKEVRYVTPFVADSEWMKKKGWKRQELPESNNAQRAQKLADTVGSTVIEVPESNFSGGITHIVPDVPINHPGINEAMREVEAPADGSMHELIEPPILTDNTTDVSGAPQTSTTDNTNAPVSGQLTTTGPANPSARRAGRPPGSPNKNTTNKSNTQSRK